MNREQMIENLRPLVVTLRCDGRTPDDLATRFLLDAILPQVSTVEELRHLLIRVAQNARPAIVVDKLERAWTLFENDRGEWWAMRVGDQDEDLAVAIPLDIDEEFDGDDLDHEPWVFHLPGPLTVVWRP